MCALRVRITEITNLKKADMGIAIAHLSALTAQLSENLCCTQPWTWNLPACLTAIPHQHIIATNGNLIFDVIFVILYRHYKQFTFLPFFCCYWTSAVCLQSSFTMHQFTNNVLLIIVAFMLTLHGIAWTDAKGGLILIISVIIISILFLFIYYYCSYQLHLLNIFCVRLSVYAF